MWTWHGEILQELSSMLLSMLDLGTTNSWSRLRKGTVGYTRTRIMVCQPQPEILLFLTWSASMMSAMASLGLSLLLDTDVGLSHVNKYTYSSKEYIKVGSTFHTMIPFINIFRLG